MRGRRPLEWRRGELIESEREKGTETRLEQTKIENNTLFSLCVKVRGGTIYLSGQLEVDVIDHAHYTIWKVYI